MSTTTPPRTTTDRSLRGAPWAAGLAVFAGVSMAAIGVIVTGAAVVLGRAWARAVGIGLVFLDLVANFLFLPYYPVWSVLLVALDVAVIWGLARYQDDPVRGGHVQPWEPDDLARDR